MHVIAQPDVIDVFSFRLLESLALQDRTCLCLCDDLAPAYTPSWHVCLIHAAKELHRGKAGLGWQFGVPMLLSSLYTMMFPYYAVDRAWTRILRSDRVS